MRDDFSSAVKDVLARRVGMRCSNPNCRRPTSGPRQDPGKSLNVGVAAHITAASGGGPRYDPHLTSEQRGSEDNGIWLCQTCAKLIDNDPARYTERLLRTWRTLSEEAALLDIAAPARALTGAPITDVDLIRFYSQCFDRPAYRDSFAREGSLDAFDRAIEDTVTALNTGCLRARDGGVLARLRGKAYIEREDWRQRLDLIVDLLRAIRSRLENESLATAVRDPELVTWMDKTRSQVLSIFREICREAGVAPPGFLPGHRSRP